MKSVGQASKALPDEFVQRLYQLFTPGQSDQILRAYAAKRPVTVRVNTLKTDIYTIMNVLRANAIKFDRVLWYENALVIKSCSEQELEQLDIYKQGHIYLQSLSSMIPPLLLNPTPGKKVLDLTAAPGSKTTQLASIMNNDGEILAVEKNKIRFERMVYNLNLQGVIIAQPVNISGETVGKKAPSYFDYALLDAPCSGEGVFDLLNSGSYRHWNERFVKKCARMQKKLFASAYDALKPGGTLVYSTCTLAPEENEFIINWALHEYDNLRVESSRLPGVGAVSALTKVFGKTVHKDIAKAIRILPSPLMEGFFCCKLRKLK